MGQEARTFHEAVETDDCDCCPFAQQRPELPPFGDGLGGVATMLKGVPISLRRARRCAAVHPAAPRRGRLLK